MAYILRTLASIVFVEIEKLKKNIISKLLLIIASGGFIRILKKVII